MYKFRPLNTATVTQALHVYQLATIRSPNAVGPANRETTMSRSGTSSTVRLGKSEFWPVKAPSMIFRAGLALSLRLRAKSLAR